MKTMVNFGNDFLREVRASYAFVERNFNLTRRYIGWELVFLSYSIVNTLTIGLIGFTQGKDQILYLVVGAMLWGFLSILFHEVSESMAYERWEGTIEYTFMAPIRRLTHLMGTCTFAAVYGLIRSLLLLAGAVIFFDLSLKGANITVAFATLFLSSLSFLGLGLMAAVMPLLSTERGSQATHIIQGFILLISGVYYEIDVLPAWLRPFSAVSPATYTLRAIRAALLHGAGFRELAPTLLGLTVTGLLLIPVGYVIFMCGERYAKTTGKLKRSG